jgi:hypothetical protein
VVFGWTIQQFTILICLSVGTVATLCGIVLIFIRRTGASQIEIPYVNLKISTDIPGVVVLIIGGILLGYPLLKAYEKPQTFSVVGSMTFSDGSPVSSLAVGILATNRMALTVADGTYRVTIPKDDEAHNYQVVVQIPNTNPPRFTLGAVRLDARGGDASFHQVFPKGGR